MKSKKILPAVLLGSLAFSAAACNSTLTLTEGTTGSGFIVREVAMSDYKFKPEHIKVQADTTVRFVVKNDGDYTHEFRILVDPPQHIEVPPKSKDRLDVVFEKGGDFEFICTISDHERLGMKGEISVETVE